MAFKVRQGKCKTIWLPKTASTALARGSIVTFTSGQLVAATAGTTAVLCAGVLDRAVVSTDADYASASLVPVLFPIEKNVVWEADVTATVETTDVGIEVDLTDASTVNPDAGSIDIAKILRVHSATKADVLLKLNGSY